MKSLAVFFLCLGLFLAACGGDGGRDAAVHILRGEVRLGLEWAALDPAAASASGADCSGVGRYSDVRAGADVHLKDIQADVIGRSTLGPGRLDAGSESCVFSFVVVAFEHRAVRCCTLTFGSRGEFAYGFSDIAETGRQAAASPDLSLSLSR